MNQSKSNSQKKVIVIGAGFSGLSAATSLAAMGFNVSILEKHDMAGGRARKFESAGFTFDMGPSWYWMPDVFERYFYRFGKSTSDYYDLIRLDPSYSIYFNPQEKVSLPASMEGMEALFESYEKGAGLKLRKFLKAAKIKYDIGIRDLVYKPGLSLLEYISSDSLRYLMKLSIFQTFNSYTRKYFKDQRLLQMLEFPVLFLGGTGKTTPALYSLMNYGDIALGTWYPMGGMYSVVEGMVKLAEEQGVRIIYSSDVESLPVRNGKIREVIADGVSYNADIVVSSADYNFTEMNLLHESDRSYSEKYWNKRVMSPSSLIFFLGLNRKIRGLDHHTLFFDEDFSRHAASIYDQPAWPENPSLYFSCTSKTDPSVAPSGYENLMVLIPVAPGLEDNDDIREKYYKIVMERINKILGENIEKNVIYKRSYALNDFSIDYNAFQGNAYGLANTLLQTAFLKPKLKSRKVENLYYTGQLTVPGPGVPPALISGQVVADVITKTEKS
ncbi:MAG: phytoene desaturase [Bacteroidetes bacterium]|nr:phytoene desaturase [Bacteroidota bacterium]